jgi:hypothetical protein
MIDRIQIEKSPWPKDSIDKASIDNPDDWGFLLFFTEGPPEFIQSEKPSREEIQSRWGNYLAKRMTLDLPAKVASSIDTPLSPFIRDELGFGFHPLIPDVDDEFIDLSSIPEFSGCTFHTVDFEQDAPEHLQEFYYGKGNPDVSSWMPTPPTPSSILIGVVDTDDGPKAYFVTYEKNH